MNIPLTLSSGARQYEPYSAPNQSNGAQQTAVHMQKDDDALLGVGSWATQQLEESKYGEAAQTGTTPTSTRTEQNLAANTRPLQPAGQPEPYGTQSPMARYLMEDPRDSGCVRAWLDVRTTARTDQPE